MAKLTLLPWLSRMPSSMNGEDSPDELISTAQHVIDELRPLFRNDVAKNELLFAIQQFLNRYSNWDEPGLQDNINQHISL